MARTAAQAAYLALLRSASAPVVVATGRAGTGKTFLAVTEAAAALLRGDVQRLVLVRPTVCAGEELGFLPGTIDDKLHPFVRPMLDALGQSLTKREIQALRERGRIELAPLAYMRGRTFSKAWVILDEAQNTTPAQMRMALTRLGDNARMTVTGDLDQVDLPRAGVSGLADLLARLPPASRLIHHAHLTDEDVQRSDAVREVLKIYSTVRA